MKSNLKTLKIGLMVDIIMMVVFTIYAIWAILHNHEFSYNNEMVILSTSLQVKNIIALILTSATVLYPLYLMIKLIKNIENTKVFNKENIKIMEKIGFYLAIFVILSILGFSLNGELNVKVAKEVIMAGKLDIWGFNLNFSVITVAILSVVSIIIAMVEVLKEGLNLKEENDLTV